MSDLEALKNRGLCPLGEPPAPGPKTIVVVGVARGGTSIVAGALAKLGVFMGERAGPPVFEDVRLAKAIDHKQWNEVRAIIDDYDQRAAVWGFKRPSSLPHLSALHLMLRKPVYVVLFRDVLAIANRNVLSMKAELVPAMRQALDGYAEVLRFVEQADASALLVSVEKVMLHKEAFLGRLVDYLALGELATPPRRQAASDFITVDPPNYLESSRLRFLGHVDRATPRYVGGWAYIRNELAPVELRVLVNGNPVGEITADRPRKDVKERTAHPTGRCGFRFEFADGERPRIGDEVSVLFARGGEHLNRSPRVVEQHPEPAQPAGAA